MFLFPNLIMWKNESHTKELTQISCKTQLHAHIHCVPCGSEEFADIWFRWRSYQTKRFIRFTLNTNNYMIITIAVLVLAVLLIILSIWLVMKHILYWYEKQNFAQRSQTLLIKCISSKNYISTFSWIVTIKNLKTN